MASPNVAPSPAGSSSISRYASYVPNDLPYNEAYDNAVMQVILHPDPNAKKGIRVIPDDSDEKPEDGVSVRHSDIDLDSLPVILEQDLPLQLDDSRRIYASTIPGILLTHPGGYHEGGPGLDPEMDTFPEDFHARHGNVSAAELQAAKDKDVKVSMEQLRKQMQAREKAIEDNANTARKLKALSDQHELELKLCERTNAEQKLKREVKERKRAEREAAVNSK